MSLNTSAPGDSVIAYKSTVLLAIFIFFPFNNIWIRFSNTFLITKKKKAIPFLKRALERAEYPELINLCGRIPLIFQRTAKARTEKSLRDTPREVKAPHLSKARLTPRNEASPSLRAERTANISAFYVIEREEKQRQSPWSSCTALCSHFQPPLWHSCLFTRFGAV